MTKAIRRQIYCISFWNFIVLFGMIYLGPIILDLEYGINDTFLNSKPKMKHMQYIYNTFVFLQLFNQINCRKIGPQDLNVFNKFFHNFWFLIVFIGEFFFQVLFAVGWKELFGSQTKEGEAISDTQKYLDKTGEKITEYTGELFKGSLTKHELGSCIVLGSTVLAVSFFLKLTPDSFLDRFESPLMMNENKKVEGNKALDGFNKVSSMKIDADALTKGSGSKKDDDYNAADKNV